MASSEDEKPVSHRKSKPKKDKIESDFPTPSTPFSELSTTPLSIHSTTFPEDDIIDEPDDDDDGAFPPLSEVHNSSEDFLKSKEERQETSTTPESTTVFIKKKKKTRRFQLGLRKDLCLLIVLLL